MSPVFLFSWPVLLKLHQNEALLDLLLVLLLSPLVLAVCPSVCSCGRSHRDVDCSWRALSHLPDGLQHNMLSLNLSHNLIHNLDGQLAPYTHLRLLDLSHNHMCHLPIGLPRSLWHLYASSNRLKLLDKNDTVYQWNLRSLDLSNNKLERAIFINNTLINLCMLNLSHNNFWTFPTNLPAHLKTIDLSHNLLVKVLPGSLDRLRRLTHFYLHANRFSTLPLGALDHFKSLSVISLGNNPWACHRNDDVSYLISWVQQTPAHVLGCPCLTQQVCGRLHFASYNQPDNMSSINPEANITEGWSLSISSVLGSPKENSTTLHHTSSSTRISIPTLPIRSTSTHLSRSASPAATDFTTQTATRADGAFMTESSFIQTKTTTLHTKSVKRQNQPFQQTIPDSISSISPTITASSLLLILYKLAFLSLLSQHIL